MVGRSKKTAKGRLDKYYHLAKEQGYRARSAFKLIQLNRKFQFLEKARVLIDLCAAPGGWLQVAAKNMPMSHLIIGVDLVPIKPIPGVITFASDITTETCRSNIKKELKDWQADVVLHDGAPNVGSAWVQDAFSQAELVLMSLKLAVEFLKPGGTFVTKVFRSKDYNALMWVLTQLFKHVEATKPASSRNVSAEIFVVCQEFLAPKKIDPKFFDPKSVFQEVDLPIKPVNIFKPEKRSRQRDGYEDGATVLFKAASAKDFLESADPIAFLGSYSQIQFPSNDPISEWALSHELTTAELKDYCNDLKLLGKREFKMLLKWRQLLKKEHKKTETGASQDALDTFANVIEETPLSDTEQIEALLEEQDKKARRQKKRLLMKRAKERYRMQLGMQTESGAVDPELGRSLDQELFSLPTSLSSDILKKYDTESSSEEYPSEDSINEDEEDDDTIQCEEDDLNVNLRASLLTDKESKLEDQKKANLIFSRPLFQSFEDELCPTGSDDDGVAQKHLDSDTEPYRKKIRAEKKKDVKSKNKLNEESENDIEFVKPEKISDNEEVTEADKIALLSPEGMTAALKLVQSKSSKRKVIDDSFNRFAFNDTSDLPSWFKEDENKHNKPTAPISKEAVDILKAKLKTMESRPIKKALEAKLRKKGKVLKRLQALKNKAGIINENEELNEAQKAGQIQKMLRNATKGLELRQRPKLVIARGANKGISSRPKGVKGRYKMVDSRMKKEVRAMKRIQKRQKKRN